MSVIAQANQEILKSKLEPIHSLIQVSNNIPGSIPLTEYNKDFMTHGILKRII